MLRSLLRQLYTDVSVPSSNSPRRMHSSWAAWPLEVGPIGCPEMSVSFYAARNPGFFLDGLMLEDGTDRLSRNVGNQLPIYDA